MPLNIGELQPKEPVLSFVSRKKRKLADSGDSKSPQSFQSQLEADDSVKPAESQQLPQWRLNKPAPDSPVSESRNLKWTEKIPEEMSDRDWRIMCTDLNIQSSKPFHPLLSWNELVTSNLSKYLIKEFYQPTAVQRSAISLVLQGWDIVIQAPTGSGKTLGFLVPFIETKPARSLILAPTRELASQIAEVCRKLPCSVNTALLIGGMEISDQVDQLASNPAIIIATPGRLLDFVNQKLVDLSRISYLVFDEADRMIDLGFEPQIEEIMQFVPKRRQTLMFSATWPLQVQELSGKYLRSDFVTVKVGRLTETINQTVEFTEPEAKMGSLLKILKSYEKKSVIVFVATRVIADKVAEKLTSSQIKCVSLHGNLSQETRNRNLKAFALRKMTVLVATDVASRGMDIPGVALVVNFDMPSTIDTYIHRIGRTGRAESKGRAISLVTEENRDIFPELKRTLRQSKCSVPSFL